MSTLSEKIRNIEPVKDLSYYIRTGIKPQKQVIMPPFDEEENDIKTLKEQGYSLDEVLEGLKETDGDFNKAYKIYETTPQMISKEEVQKFPLQTAGRFLGEQFKKSQKAQEQIMPEIGGTKIDVAGFAAPLKAVKTGQAVAKEAPRIFKGAKDLTTKFLEYAKGKTTLSRQEITDFAKRPELKKGEADLLLKKLEEFEPKTISDFEIMVKEIEKTAKKLGGKVKNIHLIGSQAAGKATELSDFDIVLDIIKPFKISSKIDPDYITYFAKTRNIDKQTARQLITLEENLPTNIGKKSKEGRIQIVTNTQQLNKKYPFLKLEGQTKLPAQEFADSIQRDLLELKPVNVGKGFRNITIENRGGKSYEEVVFESPITTNGSSHYPNSKNYFAHARGDEVVEGGKKIWREQEIQSDLLQKENLERQFDDFSLMEGNENRNLLEARLGHQGLVDARKLRGIEKEKLQPFTNDRFGERIMRERIKAKAQKGYEKYRLPTGETIGKIEGFQQNTWRIDATGKIARNIDDFKVGMQVTDANASQEWIITDILGDGRFKAISKNHLEDITSKEIMEGKPLKIKSDYSNVPDIDKETFDLMGKSNPQYRRYSDWGKFLKNKYGGKEITDLQGNSWIEIDLKSEYKRMPIEAFGLGVLGLKKEEQR